MTYDLSLLSLKAVSVLTGQAIGEIFVKDIVIVQCKNIAGEMRKKKEEYVPPSKKAKKANSDGKGDGKETPPMPTLNCDEAN